MSTLNTNEGKNKSLQCLVNQVQEIEEPQTQLKYKDGYSIINEMLADVAAINVSLNAFRIISQEDEQLPGLTQFSSEQLFFMSMATVSFSFLSLLLHNPQIL